MKTPNSPCTEANSLLTLARGSKWLLLAMLAVLSSLGLCKHAQAQALSNRWEILPGSRPYLSSTDGSSRGMGYNILSNQVVVQSRTGGNAVYVLDGDTGADLWSLQMTDSTGNPVGAGANAGNLLGWNNLTVAEDGAVYGFNLASTPPSTVKIFRWADTNPNTVPTVAYLGDPGFGFTNRWADGVAIRGTGPNTEILLGSGGLAGGFGTNVILLTTTNGTDFSPTRIDITGIAPGEARFGLSFYTNNTFFAKIDGHPLYLIQYTAVPGATNGQGVVKATFPNSSAPLQLIAASTASRQLAGLSLTGPSRIELFDISNPGANPTFLTQTNFTKSNANANGTGAIAFGGSNRTNRLYSLWSNNGLRCEEIVYSQTAVAPAIVSQPAGNTVYTNYGAITLSVSASGSLPLSYQWQFNSNNIPGATSATYTINFPTASASGFYTVIITNVAGSVTSAPAQLRVLEPVTNPSVTPLWKVAVNSRSYLANDNNCRGMGFDPVTTNVVVASRTTPNGFGKIFIIDGNTGADVGELITAGLTEGPTFDLNAIGVADDGVVYAGNLSTASTPNFILYRWPAVDPNAIPDYAFGGSTGGDPGNGLGSDANNKRWGDTIAVRGAGTDTQILLATRGTLVSVLTTTDGLQFTPNPINVAGVPTGFAALGIAFGDGNTFWAKTVGNQLRKIQFDLSTGTGTVVESHNTSTLDFNIGPIAVDVANNLLGGVAIENGDNFKILQLNGPGNDLTLLDQRFFATDNNNVNDTGAAYIGNGRAYALDSNNGIVALKYTIPFTTPLSPFSISDIVAQSGSNGLTLTWQSVAGRSYQVQYKDSLTSGSWTNVGSPITASGSTASYTDTVSGTGTRFYRIQGL